MALFFATLVVLMPLNAALAAVLVGIAYAIFSFKVQRKMMNPQKTKEIQAKIQALTKEMNEMAKRKEDIAPKQAELMPLLKESMQTQMKGMFVILPIFFIVYYGLMPLAFSAFNHEIFNTFIIPMSYGTLFIASAVVAALLMNLVIVVRDRMAAKKLKAQAGGAVQVSGEGTAQPEGNSPK